MVTGEQRLFAHDTETSDAHCTYTADDRRDIFVINKIQMLKDVDRGTAWTGLCLELPLTRFIYVVKRQQ
ncbi:unnamed protein product [Meloidogyne enterolobii]|uniref:Uncharacterized protein n=1 Tax=Meloidogyne enterolobii TaxID=390850 RepID=A0ACB1AWF5_MELEN